MTTKAERAATKHQRIETLVSHVEREAIVITRIARVLGEAHEPMLLGPIARAVGATELETKDAIQHMLARGFVQKIGKRYATAGLSFPKTTRTRRALSVPRKGDR